MPQMAVAEQPDCSFVLPTGASSRGRAGRSIEIVRFWQILLQKSAYRRRETLMPLCAAVAFHTRDCAGDLRSTLLTLATLTQRIKGRLVVAGRPTWPACGGSAQSL